MKRASEILLYLFGAVSLFSGFIYGHTYILALAEAFLLASIFLSTDSWLKRYCVTALGVFFYVALFNQDNNIMQAAEVALLCFSAFTDWKSYKAIVAQGFLFGGVMELIDMKFHLNNKGLRVNDYLFTLAWLVPTFYRYLSKYYKDKQTNCIKWK